MCMSHMNMHNELMLFKMQSYMKWTRSSKLHNKNVFVYILLLEHLFAIFIFRKSELGMFDITISHNNNR